MSIIDYTLYPRSDLDVDFWMLPDVGRSMLDFFDVFDPLDLRRVENRLDWLVRPDWLSSALTSGSKNVPFERPRKFRIAVDIRGINKQSVKTHVSEDNTKLIVTAKEGEIKDREADNYTLREIKRTYKLPANAEVEKLASYMAPNGKLIIEIPFGSPAKEQPKKEQIPQQKEQQPSEKTEQAKEHPSKEEKVIEKEKEKSGEETGERKKFEVITTQGPIEDILPRIVDGKQVEMRIHLPDVVDASKVRVTCKDNDLIVMVRDEQEKWDNLSELFYYRRTPMPESTDFAALKCTLEGNHLIIRAPVLQKQQQQPEQKPVEQQQQPETQQTQQQPPQQKEFFSKGEGDTAASKIEASSAKADEQKTVG